MPLHSPFSRSLRWLLVSLCVPCSGMCVCVFEKCFFPLMLLCLPGLARHAPHRHPCQEVFITEVRAAVMRAGASGRIVQLLSSWCFVIRRPMPSPQQEVEGGRGVALVAMKTHGLVCVDNCSFHVLNWLNGNLPKLVPPLANSHPLQSPPPPGRPSLPCFSS